MRKSVFRNFLQTMLERAKHVSKSRAFDKLLDNPAGTKLAKRASKLSRRGCDGTMRS